MISFSFRRLYGLWLVLLLPVALCAQDLDGTPLSNKAQTEAARGSGGGGASSIYAPNLFDGSVDIKIPIYDYAAGKADLGVALSYNTRGVKLDELASSAGLHFGIKAEGSISRIIKGLPDELSTGFDYTVTYDGQNYNSARGRLAHALGGLPTAGVYLDSESDEFMVSAGSLSFSFMIGRSGQVFTNPSRGVRVAVLANGSPYMSASVPPSPLSLEFEVTDEQGNRYYFTKGDYSHRFLYLDITKTQPGYQVAEYAYIDRWVVRTVRLADGRTLSYDYSSSDGYANSLYKSYNYKGLPDVPGGGEATGSDFRTRLQHIRYPNGVSATFLYEGSKGRCDLGGELVRPDSSILTEIRIGTGSSRCLRYKLHQVYVVADPANPTQEIPITDPCRTINNSAYSPGQTGAMAPYRNHRLRLKSITIMSCDGSREEPYYSFSYDPLGLPPRFRAGQDWYGYYNGQQPVWPFTGYTYDPDLGIPYHSETRGAVTLAYGVNRSPSLAHTKAGSLNSVTNAYGGNIRFTYSRAVTSNPYAAYDAGAPTDPYFFGRTDNVTDGLLVDSIIESEPYHPDNLRITTFDYGGGFAFLRGSYYHYPKTQPDYNTGPAAPGIFTNNRLCSQSQINGSYHGFSTVNMYVRNNTGQQLSRREVTFTTLRDDTNGWQYRYLVAGGGKKYYQYPFTDKQYLRDWEIGLPVTVNEYDDLNQMVQTTTNSYSFSLDTLGAVQAQVDGSKKAYIQISELNPATKVLVSDNYKPYRGKSLLMNTIVKKYMSYGATISDAVAYTYDSRDNLSRVATTNSAGEEVQTIHYYNYDAGAADPMPGLEKLATTQRWKRIAGTTGPLPENGLLLDAYFHGTTKEGAFPAFEKIWDKNLYIPLSSQPQTYSAYLGTGADNSTALKIKAAYNNTTLTGFRKASEVLQADPKGNPLETYLEQGQQYKAMIWDTATGQKLAEAVGCRYSEMAYTGFETGNDLSNFYFTPSGNGILFNGGVCGKTCMSLWNTFSGYYNSLASQPTLQADREYVLSFWVSGPLPTVLAGGIQQTLPAPVAVKDNWKQYELYFTPATSGTRITITGTAAGAYLDEVRLHPASALVQSWNSDPMLGTTSATDARGRITYYEYDAMGRPYLVRDQEGHILSKTQYTLRGAE